jgi:basic amino acid/polyamine antiporter, APA family
LGSDRLFRSAKPKIYRQTTGRRSPTGGSRGYDIPGIVKQSINQADLRGGMTKPSILESLFRKKSLAQLQKELDQRDSGSLVRSLTLLDLTCFGIAAVVGAGIFSTIGTASYDGGPAISLLFVLTAIACLFSALCYAEFASKIPVSGSAYTYSFAAFGEFVAWIIGWNLLMEYAIGNSVLAFAWSEYFMNLIDGMGIPFPRWLCNDYYSCSRAPGELQSLVSAGEPATESLQRMVKVWETAPSLMGFRFIVDLPALMINLIITALVYIGIHESKVVSNAMVFLKLGVIVLVIVVGFNYIRPENWSPFAPNGLEGVFKGIAAVFFAYIGFDAISTTAEECRNPQRDIPRATMLTLALCTVIYIVLALVLTGMVSYRELNVQDPLAFVFGQVGLNVMVGIVSVSAVIATASVFLVFQLGQPRIFMSMARDGMLPDKFAEVHPRFKTPAFATLITGLMVALPTIFLSAPLVTDLCAIGTLFAFALVSAGILVVGRGKVTDENREQKGFHVPYLDGRIWLPIGFAIYTLLLPRLPSNHIFWGAWWTDAGFHWDRIPYLIFYAIFAAMTVGAVRYRWSTIPVLGVVVNLYLVAGLGAANWIRFGGWCAAGVLVYAFYSFHNSRRRRGTDA